MTHDWHSLTQLTGGRKVTVTEVRLEETGIEIRGEFELPPLVGLPYEDQVFVGEFVRSHGSIKQMEKAFGVSYPTIKNRLNRIAAELQLVQIETTEPESSADEVLSLLESGEISAEDAVARLRG